MTNKRKPVVELKAEDIALVNTVMSKFNLASGATPARRVSVTLDLAASFVASIADDLVAGSTITTGSAWHGPDLFLDLNTATDMGERKDTALDTFKKFPTTKKTKDALEKVRKAFNLKSEKQAASLCMKAYANLADGLWRGNSFVMEMKNGKDKPFSARKFVPKLKGSAAKKPTPKSAD